MRRDLTSLITDLKNGSATRCLLLFGDDLRVQQTSNTIINLLIPEAERALNLERLDGRVTPWEQVEASLVTPPLFTGVKVVWLENAPYFTSRDQKPEVAEKILQFWGDGKQEEASKLLIRLLILEGWTQERWERLEPGAACELTKLLDAAGEEEVDKLLVHCKTRGIDLSRHQGSDGQRLEEFLKRGLPPWGFLLMTAVDVDRRMRLYKHLDDLNAVVYLGLQRDRSGRASGEELCEFINSRLREAGKKADSQARELLIGRSASDLRSLGQEIDKLLLYSDERSAVRAQDVETIVTDYSEGWVFDLTVAISERNPRVALSCLARLIARGEHPLKLLAIMASDARRLLAARQSLHGELRAHWRPGMSYVQFQRQVLTKAPHLARNPKAEYMSLLRAERFSMTDLCCYMAGIHDADFRLKSSGSHPRLILERLILRMCVGRRKNLARDCRA